MNPPRHDTRIKGPAGSRARPKGAIVHCTVSNPIPNSPRDRHGVIDYLAGKGISVPVCNDDESSTVMTPLGTLGYGHAGCLSGEAWGIEQIGQATWSRKEWLRHRETVESTGRWAAWFLAERMGLPVTMKNLKRFVVGHDKDHKLGGCSDHWDPGPGYPWDVMYAAAIAEAKVKGYRVVATKGDRKKARSYRAPLGVRAKQFTRKWTRRGWNVVTRKKIFRADFDAFD